MFRSVFQLSFFFGGYVFVRLCLGFESFWELLLQLYIGQFFALGFGDHEFWDWVRSIEFCFNNVVLLSFEWV